MIDENKITYFAETDHRKRLKFGIKVKDRSKHVYVIGKTGMGKSTLLENMAVQDINNGEGLVFIDPHGKSADLLLDYIPKHRVSDVLYIAPFDLDNPIAFNIMEDVGYDKRHIVVSGLVSAFKKIWVDTWSARMEYILSNTLLALLEYPDTTLLGVNRMLIDKSFRKKVVENIKDPTVKSFWVDEFAQYTDRYTQEATPAIQNKIGQFTSNPLIRNIVGQPKSSFDFREMIDKKKIIIVNLSKGRVGEINANLLGSMLIIKLYLAAMGRADVSEQVLRTLPPTYLYVDEFQSFANESFADILSEARKYKLSITLAHQYIEQMSDEVRAAVFGNVGTMVCFRVGAYDAEVLEKEFAPEFTAEDLVNLGFTQIYLRLMIDGVSSKPFSARTLGPIPIPMESNRREVVELSRRIFGRPRDVVEKNIVDWFGPPPVKSAPSERKSENRGNNKNNKRSEKRFDNNKSGNQEASNNKGSATAENGKEKKISLSDLTNKHKPKGEDMSELRRVLEGAMEKHKTESKQPQKQDLSPKDEEITRKDSNNDHEMASGDMQEPKLGNTNKEIPEEELRKLLRVDPAE